MSTQIIFNMLIEIVSISGLIIGIIKFTGTRVLSKIIDENITNIFLKEKTQITESVKKEFNESLESFKKTIQLEIAKEIEPFKAALSRGNIAFQIVQTEYIKRRFLRLEELFAKFYEIRLLMSRKIQIFDNVTIIISDEDQKEIDNLLNDCITLSYLSTFYLDEESRKAVRLYINSISTFLKSYNEYKKAKSEYEYMEYHNFCVYYQVGEEDDYEVDAWDNEKKQEKEISMKDLNENIKKRKDVYIIEFNNIENAIKKILNQNNI